MPLLVQFLNLLASQLRVLHDLLDALAIHQHRKRDFLRFLRPALLVQFLRNLGHLSQLLLHAMPLCLR